METSVDRVQQAEQLYASDFSCAQSVFAAFAPDLGLDAATALRTAGVFGGGMARMGEVCGAVTGAFMALGLKYASSDPQDQEAKERTARIAQEFAARFRQRHGTLLCRELLGIDMSDPAARQAAKEQGLFKLRCPVFVHDAAEIVRELLE